MRGVRTEMGTSHEPFGTNAVLYVSTALEFSAL